MGSVDDYRADARIRSAAIELFGRQGIRATTVRQIAQQAGVSAGLIIHHFGSKDGLRGACDDWIVRTLTLDKEALARGDEAALQRLSASLQNFAPYMRYLSESMREGGGSDRLFQVLCEATEAIMDAGISAGTMRVPPDRDAAIATLVAISCGVTMFSQHIARALGGQDLLEPTISARYAAAALDIFTNGVMTDSSLARRTAAAFTQQEDHT